MQNREKITAGIHQPNFLPWIGYFYKMAQSSRFVLLDDVQFIRRGYTNRVKVKSQTGGIWLTVPVIKKGRYHQLINEVELEPGVRADAKPGLSTRTPGDHWKNKILGTLQACYGKTPYYKTYIPQLAHIIQQPHHLLVELNTKLIRHLAQLLNIHTPIDVSSQLPGITGQSTDRLASICTAVGASHYLSGFGGQKYQEEEIFHRHKIDPAIYDFTHPQYGQTWDGFLSGLSIVDLLFNCGPKSADIIKNIANINGDSDE